MAITSLGEASNNRVVVWFSCGAASAVAAYLAIQKYGDSAVIVNCDTLSSEHPDNLRFFYDVEVWLKRSIGGVPPAGEVTRFQPLRGIARFYYARRPFGFPQRGGLRRFGF